MGDLVDDFRRLFQGRDDVVGTDEGGCVRTSTSLMTWRSRWDEHLSGRRPMGVYPLFDSGNCAWGCVDIDENVIEHALNLRTAFHAFDVQAYVEVSRSKGFHVWVLMNSDLPIEAALMRKALQAACQLTGAPDREVNPKQIDTNGGVGNYVRLPYPGGLDGIPLRQVVLDSDNKPCTLAEFTSHALRHSTDQVGGLSALARLYVPPARPVVSVPPASELQGDPIRRMGGLPYTIFQYGPREGEGRGKALWTLICRLVDAHQHTQDEIVHLALDADARWGKFHDRPNGDEQVRRQVEKAYR